jgi:hypothetical protein
MKLVFYTEQNKVVEVLNNIIEPEVEGNSVSWKGGELKSIRIPFLLVDDTEVSKGDDVTDDLLANDKKAEFKSEKERLRAENEDLKRQLAQLNADLGSFMDFFFSGEATA